MTEGSKGDNRSIQDNENDSQAEGARLDSVRPKIEELQRLQDKIDQLRKEHDETDRPDWVEAIGEEMVELQNQANEILRYPSVDTFVKDSEKHAKQRSEYDKKRYILAKEDYRKNIVRAKVEAGRADEALRAFNALDDGEEKARLANDLYAKTKEITAVIRAKTADMTEWQKKKAYDLGLEGSAVNTRFDLKYAEKIRQMAEQAKIEKSWFHTKELYELPKLLMDIHAIVQEKIRSLEMDKSYDDQQNYNDIKRGKYVDLIKTKTDADTYLRELRDKAGID